MAIHIVMEPGFAAGTWGNSISQGILNQAKQKRIDCIFEQSAFRSESTDLIALIGTSPVWIQQSLETLRTNHHAHLILISNTPYPWTVHHICTDLGQAMLDIQSYLQDDCGKKSIAFYGVNPSSTADLQKLHSFSSSDDNVYYSNNDLQSCFRGFYEKVNQYDAVICANDYAAISLIRNLKQIDPALNTKLFLVSFANTHVAQKHVPSITSVALDYYEYGRSCVNLYRLLLQNPQISTANINIRCRIIPRDTTRHISYTAHSTPNHIAGITDNVFFRDEEIRDLNMLETLLSIQDETDEKIIALLADGCSYEQAAQELFMSVNGIKYRLKRLLEISGIESRREMVEIYRKYLK